MRKFLRIVFYVLLMLFFFRSAILPREYINETYVYIVYFTLMVFYTIYELIQVWKDDKKNNTQTFRYKLYAALMGFGLLILIVILLQVYK
jgi:4-hydroxybenzoate polyprenyltransferase